VPALLHRHPRRVAQRRSHHEPHDFADLLGNVQVHHIRNLAISTGSVSRKGRRGQRSWQNGAAKPLWFARTVMTTSIPDRKSRNLRSSESRMPLTGHVRFGGGPRGKWSAFQAARRVAYPAPDCLKSRTDRPHRPPSPPQDRPRLALGGHDRHRAHAAPRPYPPPDHTYPPQLSRTRSAGHPRRAGKQPCPRTTTRPARPPAAQGRSQYGRMKDRG
jgi:hypothetical protein